MKVASFIVLIVIATSVSFASSYGCEKTSKTRSHKDNCTLGGLFKVNYKLARAGEIPENSKVCRKHKNDIEKQDNHCSFPCDRHSTTLVPIPSRLYETEYGKGVNTYKPGTMWCTNCRKVGEEELKSTEEYKPPTKRKRTKTDVHPNKETGVYQTSPTSTLSKIFPWSLVFGATVIVLGGIVAALYLNRH